MPIDYKYVVKRVGSADFFLRMAEDKMVWSKESKASRSETAEVFSNLAEFKNFVGDTNALSLEEAPLVLIEVLPTGGGGNKATVEDVECRGAGGWGRKD